MKHDLTKYKVPCKGKKEAKHMRWMLKQMGEKIEDWFDFKYNPDEKVSLWVDIHGTGGWRLGINHSDEEITFPQLIKMIEENKSNHTHYRLIEVNSQRELDFCVKDCRIEYNGKYPVYYEDSNYIIGDIPKGSDHKIIPFSDFAKEVGIEVPKFVMKSEDEVDLYEEDSSYVAEFNSNKWHLRTGEFCINSVFLFIINSMDGLWKVFSTKEAAEKWIKEKNEPDYVEVVNDRGESICIKKDGTILIKNNNGFLREFILQHKSF